MKRLTLLTITALSLSAATFGFATLSQAAPQVLTGRPYDVAQRPLDPQPVFCVNADGSQNNCGGIPTQPLGYQQITSLTSSTALTVPTGATYAVIIPEAQAVRWRDDGTNPTATVGQPLAVAVPLVYQSPQGLAAIRFIAQTAGAILNIVYYK